jgi:hypothetical protein
MAKTFIATTPPGYLAAGHELQLFQYLTVSKASEADKLRIAGQIGRLFQQADSLLERAAIKTGGVAPEDIERAKTLFVHGLKGSNRVADTLEPDCAENVKRYFDAYVEYKAMSCGNQEIGRTHG